MKKKINIENYEAYLLDLSEGNLSLKEEKELVSFLAQHPDLDAELEDLPLLSESEESLDFSFKASLQKDAQSKLSKKDHLMIASVEEADTDEEKGQLQQLIKGDESLLQELAYFQKTRLPLEEIAFPNKAQLYKRESRVIPLWAYVSSIAAAILALVIFNIGIEAPSYEPRGIALEVKEVNDLDPTFAFVIEEAEQESTDETKNTPFRQELDEQAASSPQLAQESKDESLNAVEEIIPEIESLPNNEIAQQEALQPKKVNQAIDPGLELLANANSSDEQKKAAKEPTEIKEILTPLEYARKLLKEDVLKNRSLAESLMNEVSSLTNEKVKYKKLQAEENDERAQFALNIGKFKFSRK